MQRRPPPRVRWLPIGAGLGAGTAVLALGLVVAFLVVGAASGRVDWKSLLTSRTWDPSRQQFGAAAMVWGTAAVATIAVAIAAPVGWGAAIAVAEVVPAKWGRALRAGAELLAVVPSIVYGLVGIIYIRPLVARLAGVPGGDSLLAAGLVLAVMILPTVVAVSVDTLHGVPPSVREAAAACGLTRAEVIRSAVLPQARRGFGAALALALARALGETIAVFLLVGRADGRLPLSPLAAVRSLVHPGQTLTTKLNSPESIQAGTSGTHWAALCAVGLVLLALVAALTVLGRRTSGTNRRSTRTAGWLRPARRARRGRDRAMTALYGVALALPVALVAALVAAAATRGKAAWHPSFWWSPATGASGGGIRDQLTGTLVVVTAAGGLAAPIGLGLGLVMAEYADARLAVWLRTTTLIAAGVPSILLGLWGYWLFSTRFGWGKSWLAGAIALAVVAIPAVAVAVQAAAGSLAPEQREAALAAGLRHDQVVRSVVLPQTAPGLATGLLLGLARAAGETAPLLFTATVFSGAPRFPTGIRQSPVVALPSHIFNLAQDAADPAAARAAWGAALVLIVIAGLMVLAAAPFRRRTEGQGL